MKKYRIGEVAKMLDIPAETIRFLEQKGLISPEKDKENGYRYYSIWDVNQILDYQKYRQIGFSTKETVDIVNSGQLMQLNEQLENKKSEAAYLARYYQAKMQKLNNFQTLLTSVQKMNGKYLIMNRPDHYALFTRTIDETGIHVTNAKAMAGSYDVLTKHYPFVEHIYCIRRECVLGNKKNPKIQNGLTIKSRWVDEFHLSLSPETEHFPAVSALFTIIKVGSRQSFTPDLLKDALFYMQKNHLELSGDVTGIYIASVKEENEMIRYMELWIPIKSDDSNKEASFEGQTEDFVPLKNVFK